MRTIAEYILNKLDISYITTLPSNITLAVDTYNTLDYDLNKLNQNISIENRKLLYTQWIVVWLLKCKPISKFDWGFVDDNITPFLLTEPFNAYNNFYYHTLYNLPITPSIMVYVVKDDIYTILLKDIYTKLEANYNDIIYFINSYDISVVERCRILEIFITNYNELKNIYN